MRLVIGALGIIATLLNLGGAADQPRVIVPFVGCPADGQLGPYAAPHSALKRVALPSGYAERLAWYEYHGDYDEIGVLAPRGWRCFATIGSNGMSLYVAPELLDADKVIFQKNWHGFAGPAVQLSESNGGTSGRFEVARVVARVFPGHRQFLSNVLAEGIEPASAFPVGPFQTDRLVYESDRLVEFITPAAHKGLGTMSWLLPSTQAIHGMARLSGADTDLTQINVRLPADLQQLTPVIVQQAEHN